MRPTLRVDAPPHRPLDIGEEVPEIGRSELCPRELRERAEFTDQAPQRRDLFLDDRPCRLELVPVFTLRAGIRLVNLLDRQLDRSQRVLDLVGEAPREVLPRPDPLQVLDPAA